MNPNNSRDFDALEMAACMLPPEPKKQILNKLNEVRDEPDEIIEKTLLAIKITLGDDFNIVT